MDNSLRLQNDYLKNVIIITSNGNSIDFKNTLFAGLNNQLVEFKKNVNDTVLQVIEKSNNEGWIDCTNNIFRGMIQLNKKRTSCFKVLSELMNKEINSTAFMLRVLSGSVIDSTSEKQDEEWVNGKYPLKFKYNGPNERLSNNWIEDSKYFELEQLDYDSSEIRLIMGLGPSASGKTHWARYIIKLIGMSNNTYSFPRSFLSIDGGLMRELSYVYQSIINAFKGSSKSGFNNLVSSGPFSKSLFNSNYIKKVIIDYLNTQRVNSKLHVSLYVPETLGDPRLRFNPLKKIQPYIKITGDKRWIGLYIWQHKKEEECDKSEEYKCKSTTNSGKNRELTEGKKYSSRAYYHSKSNGYRAIKKAPGGRIDIHNSGGKKTGETYNKSIIIEYPNEVRQYILENNHVESFNAIYVKERLDELIKIGGRNTRRIRNKNKRKRKKYKTRRKHNRKKLKTKRKRKK